MEPIPIAVSSRFSVPHSCSSVFLGNNGGFSGAKLWRISVGDEAFCLRAWPADRMDSQRLHTIHSLMRHARASGLCVIPEIYPTLDGRTFVSHDDRYWELTSWMSGRASYKEAPSSLKLREACETLARLHLCWQPNSPNLAPCPALARRRSCLQDWQSKVRSGWRPHVDESASPLLANVAERAWWLLSQWASCVESLYVPWINRPVPLQMCLCDIWHDHLLYEGDRLTGLIDFGNIKLDHVAVDLARLLGSLVEDHVDQKAQAIEAYSRVRPLADEESALVDVLDRTGTILAMANWLTWLYWEKRTFEDYEAVADRIGLLVSRVEKWS